MAAPLVVDVWADVACPWCWIGARRLATALQPEPPGSVEVRRRAFELRPDLPPEGVPREQADGSRDDRRAALDRVAEAGAADGLTFDLDRQQRRPNTRVAHRLVKLAETADRGGEAIEALYRGHFVEGADLVGRRAGDRAARRAGGGLKATRCTRRSARRG